MRAPHKLAVVLAALVLVACGGTVYDSPAIDVPIVGSSKDVEDGSGLFLQQSALDSSTGFGDFVGHARDAFGSDPARLEVVSATLAIGSGARNLNSLERVFANGTVNVSLRIDGSGTSYPLSHVSSPSGAGPLTMNAHFDSSQLTQSDYADFLAGRTHVVLRGPIASTFASSRGNASLDLTFVFRALQ